MVRDLSTPGDPTDPTDRETTYGYNAAPGSPADHGLTEIALPDGTHTYFGYDNLGRLSAEWHDGERRAPRLRLHRAGESKLRTLPRG